VLTDPGNSQFVGNSEVEPRYSGATIDGLLVIRQERANADNDAK
jgi:hypothetical protein